MKSISIEHLHAKLEKQIRLTESYTEINGLAFIIKACRLKPYDYFFKKKDEKIILYRQWFDEFGNFLRITKNKKIHIAYNDLKLIEKKIVCTDLYYGLSLSHIIKMSKMAHMVFGKDEDLFQECCLLTFLGIDDRLRSYLYWYGEWQQVSPLIMGMKGLKNIAKHLDIKHFIQLKKKENSIIPCISGEEWLSLLPANQEFIDVLARKNEIISQIIR